MFQTQCAHCPGDLHGWVRTAVRDWLGLLPLVRLETREKKTSHKQLLLFGSLLFTQSWTFYFQSVTTYILRVCQLFTFLLLSSKAFFARCIVLPVFTEGCVLCLQELSGRWDLVFFFFCLFVVSPLFMICMILVGSTVAACRIYLAQIVIQYSSESRQISHLGFLQGGLFLSSVYQKQMSSQNNNEKTSYMLTSSILWAEICNRYHQWHRQSGFFQYLIYVISPESTWYLPILKISKHCQTHR